MAVLHGDASLTPSKLEVLSAWLPTRSWAPAGEVELVASYRLDDPAGQVGIECFVLSVGGVFVHLPVTYRGAPLDGGVLVGEMEHSRLGHRWVYDGSADPVAVATLIRTIVSGGAQARLEVHRGSEKVAEREPGATVRGSGHGSVDEVGKIDGVSLESLGAVASVSAGGYDLDVLRVIGSTSLSGDGVLTATWPGFEGVVAAVRSAG